MILKLVSADDCTRLVEVSDKHPPPYYTTLLRYPMTAYWKAYEVDIRAKEPISHSQRRYRYKDRLSQDVFEYREVLT